MSGVEAEVFPSDIDLETLFNPEYLNFRLPEVTRFIDELVFDPEITNTICPEDRIRELLHEGGFVHSAELDFAISNGTMDPGELDRSVTEVLAKRDETLLPGLSGFEHRYIANSGATEAIDQLMVGLRAQGKMTKVGIIGGDYLGYIGSAVSKGIDFVQAASLEDLGEPNDDVVWFVSNPSAINGNVYDPALWEMALAAGHKFVVDAAYVDLTLPGISVDVSSPNVIAVVTSPSKPHGFVMDKYPAAFYIREKLHEAELHKKFKNIPRMLTMLELVMQEEFGPHKIAQRLRPTQLAICRDIGAVAGGEVLPSDATLMAYAVGELDEILNAYKTVNGLARPDRYTFRLASEFARRLILEQRRAA